MKIAGHSRYLLALSAVALLALAACSQRSSQAESMPASAPSAAASSPAASQSTSASKVANQPHETDENGSAAPQSGSPAASASGPQVKGIVLGESPEQVRAAVAAIMPKSARCQVEEKTDTSNPFMNLAIHTPFGIVLDCGETPTQPKYIGLFEFDGRTLSKFTFGSDLSLVAFQADKMSGKDFAQTFIDAYSIPRLEPSENQQYLTYRDTDHGWALDLYQDKSFRVYAITTAAAQSKSFN